MFHIPAQHQTDPAKLPGQIVNGEVVHNVKAPSADFVFANHGSICVLTPISDAGHDWLDEHIAPDAQAWGEGIVIEPRYAGPILEGIVADGLEVV